MKPKIKTPHTTTLRSLDFWQSWILFVLFALLAIVQTSCESDDYAGRAVDHGESFPVESVLEALRTPVAGSDPSSTKLGAFVHFSTIQSIGINQYVAVTTDTAHTVVNKQETATEVTYSIVEDKRTYKRDGTVDKLMSQFDIAFDKPSAVAEASNLSAQVAQFKEASQRGWSPVVSQQLKNYATAATETYHRLKVVTFQAPPPLRVREEENCLGIPNCTMTYHGVSFDQVYWKNGVSERIRWEFILSPDVPQISGFHMSLLFNYYPGLVKSCVSLMVAVGEGGNKTLLTECQHVVNFRFESALN